MARCLMLLLIASCCLVLFGFPIRRLEGSDGVLLVELKLEENVTSNSSWTGLIRKQGSLMLSKIRGGFQPDGASKKVPSPKSLFSTKTKNLIMDILTVASFFIFCISILGGVILGSCVYCWQSKKTLRLLKKVILMKRARTQREDIESYLDIGNYARRKRRTRWSDDEDEDSDEDDSQNGDNRWMEHLQKLFKRSRPKAHDEENPDEEDEEDKKPLKPKGRKASYHDPPKDQKRKRAAEIPDEEGDTSKSLKRKIKKVVGKGKRKKVWKQVKKSGKVAKKRLKKLKKKMKGLKKKKVVKKLKKTSKKILEATKKRTKRLKKLKLKRLRMKKLHLKQLKKRKRFQKLRLKKKKLKFKKRKKIFKRRKIKRPKMKFRKRKKIFKKFKMKRQKKKMRFFRRK